MVSLLSLFMRRAPVASGTWNSSRDDLDRLDGDRAGACISLVVPGGGQAAANIDRTAGMLLGVSRIDGAVPAGADRLVQARLYEKNSRGSRTTLRPRTSRSQPCRTGSWRT